MVASNALVYGEPKADIDIFSWDRLRFLRAQWNGPWVCIGDFNEVLSSDEHLGVSAKGEAQMQQFWDCLEDCQLVDLGFFCPRYTWNNRLQGQHNIRVRLDRVVANGLFTQMFKNAKWRI
jgi:hypothetical protein